MRVVKNDSGMWLTLWSENESLRDAMLPGERDSHERMRPAMEQRRAVLSRAPAFD